MAVLYFANKPLPPGRREAEGGLQYVLAVADPDITVCEPRDFDAVAICRAVGAFSPRYTTAIRRTHLLSLSVIEGKLYRQTFR
jgi:hypothetical protein